MIYLTKTGKEASKFCLNHKKIERLEIASPNHSTIVLDNGNVLTVRETEEEIRSKIMDYESDIYAKGFLKKEREATDE